MGWYIFEKEGTPEKGCVEIEDWGFSVHLVSEKPQFTPRLQKLWARPKDSTESKLINNLKP